MQWMADRGCFEIDSVRETLKEALRRHLGRKPLSQAIKGDGRRTSKAKSGERIDAGP
jgi:hypothetical protein